jgi:hypothetical protein
VRHFGFYSDNKQVTQFFERISGFFPSKQEIAGGGTAVAAPVFTRRKPGLPDGRPNLAPGIWTGAGKKVQVKS